MSEDGKLRRSPPRSLDRFVVPESQRAALFLGVILLAAVAGLVAAVVAPVTALIVAIALLVAIGAGIALVRFSVSPSALPAVLLSISLGLVACDALRFSSGTYGDAGIVVAAVGGVIAATRATTDRMWRLPWWLAAGSALVLASALLTTLFAPIVIPGPIRDRLFTSNVTTGALGHTSATTLVMQLLFALFVLPVCIAVICNSERRIRLATDLWLAGIAASSVVTLLQATTSLDLEKLLVHKVYSFTGISRYAGLTVHPALLGVSAAMAASVALARASVSHSVRDWGLTALYAGAVLVSGTRAAVLALLFSYLVIAMLQKRGRRTLLVAAVVACAAVPVTRLASTSGLSRLVGAAAQSRSNVSSSAAHAHDLSVGIDAVLQRPLNGWGFGAIKGAHDVPLQVASSGGVIALIGYLSVLGGALMAGIRMAPRRPELVGVVGALTAFMINSLVSNAIIDRFLYVPVGLIAAWWMLERQRSTVTHASVSELPLAPALAVSRHRRSSAPASTV